MDLWSEGLHKNLETTTSRKPQPTQSLTDFSRRKFAKYSRGQAGTVPSRRHIQGSKIAKGFPSVNLHYSKIEKAKNMNRVARRGPLARAPGALKGGHFRSCQHFCRS